MIDPYRDGVLRRPDVPTRSVTSIMTSLLLLAVLAVLAVWPHSGPCFSPALHRSYTVVGNVGNGRIDPFGTDGLDTVPTLLAA